MSKFIENIHLVKPEDLVKYVQHIGLFKVCDLYDGRAQQYAAANYSYSVIIPFDKSFSDYDRVLVDSLSEIAINNNLSVDSIVNKLLYPSYDSLKYRVSQKRTSMGVLPFMFLPELIESIKYTIASVLNDIRNPSSFHKRVYSKDVNELLEKYAFGQTEIGSYILNILCPLGEYQLSWIDESRPIQRMVNEKLMISIDKIQKDLKVHNISKIEEEIEQGIYSSNFMESLSDIYKDTRDTTINVYVDWCMDLPEMIDIPQNVLLEPKYMETVGVMAEKFKPKPKKNESKPFYGKIAGIESEPEINDRKHVVIKVSAIGDEGKKITVFAKLDYNQYFHDVDKAFQEGLNVRLSGTMNLSSAKKFIENPSFSILDS